ncbi:hypothetical protein MY9_1764 [Bacillus sp. JS]|nr:hypothetical protein MY9_1764 [Bacillus sp. JS]
MHISSKSFKNDEKKGEKTEILLFSGLYQGGKCSSNNLGLYA